MMARVKLNLNEWSKQKSQQFPAMAVIQQKFVVTNVYVKESEYDMGFKTSGMFKITPIDKTLLKKNCPIVYAGTPVTSSDVTTTMPPAQEKSAAKPVYSETESDDEVKPQLKDYAVGNKKTTKIVTTPTTNSPIPLKPAPNPKDVFNIANAMKGFVQPDSTSKANTQPKQVQVRSDLIYSNSNSLVVNNSPYLADLYHKNRSTPPNYSIQTSVQNPIKIQVRTKPQTTPSYKVIMRKSDSTVIPNPSTKIYPANQGQGAKKIFSLPIISAPGKPTILKNFTVNTTATSKVIGIKRGSSGLQLPVIMPKNVTTVKSIPYSKPMVIKLVDNNNRTTVNVAHAPKPMFTTAPIFKQTIKSPNSLDNVQKRPAIPLSDYKLIKPPVAAKSPVTTAPMIKKAVITSVPPKQSISPTPPPAKKTKIEVPVPTIKSSVEPPLKHLRTGIEITFEDGIRHFVTNLNDVLTMDDEPFKKWTMIKKGMMVAAKWTDGLHYDAKVVECYFDKINVDKWVDESESETEEKDTKKKPDDDVAVSSETLDVKPNHAIMCEKCKLVFMKIRAFRHHQRTACHSQGNTVSMEKNVKVNVVDFDKTPPTSSKDDGNFKAPRNPDGTFLLNAGTKILHKWQLRKGVSRWYCGTIVKVLGPDKDKVECEFEVLYNGEEDHGAYKLRLYEDYPTDIRIVSD